PTSPEPFPTFLRSSHSGTSSSTGTPQSTTRSSGTRPPLACKDWSKYWKTGSERLETAIEKLTAETACARGRVAQHAVLPAQQAVPPPWQDTPARAPVPSQARPAAGTTRFSRSDIARPSAISAAMNTGKTHIPVQAESTPNSGGARVEPT